MAAIITFKFTGLFPVMRNSGDIIYEVRLDGFVEFPVVGLLHVAGKTRLELEELLEQRYSLLYNDPFVLLKVTNRRAFVFFGVGHAAIINLPFEKTSLIEVIALSGGISDGNKMLKRMV